MGGDDIIDKDKIAVNALAEDDPFPDDNEDDPDLAAIAAASSASSSSLAIICCCGGGFPIPFFAFII